MRLVYVFLMGIIAITLVSCINNALEASEDKITVATTFFPLYDMTKSIVKDNGEVFSIVPIGSEPHDYQLTPQSAQKLNEADAYVTMGIEFEEFEDELIESFGKKDKIIGAGKNIDLLDTISDEHEEEEEHAEEDEDEHAHEGKDPHIWISPVNAITMSQNIREELKRIDAENAQDYDRNAEQLLSQLKGLDNEFRNGLASCKKNMIMTSHNAFAYLARDYGFGFVAISGLSPESEPTPQQIKTLVDTAKQFNLNYIFYEELVDPRVANTIADEVGAKTLELNPLEGTKDLNQNYITLMQQNLKNLRIALECS